ncbi:MAG: DNA adenine methylase [Candidatus Omnitrophota bacterium]
MSVKADVIFFGSFYFIGVISMKLKMFDALLPYFGGKRKLCPVIFKRISKYIPREQWQGKVFVDAFMGSAAVGLYAKAQGLRIVCNDIAERSYIAGKALIENNGTYKA